MARKVIGLAKNAVGRRGSTRRRWAVLLSLVFLVGAGAVILPPLLAVHDDGFFELDRNTIDAGTIGEDWNTIFTAETKGGFTSASAFAFIQDNPGGANDTSIATGGGTKDDLDIPGWQFTSGNPVDKDDLLNGYAARYGDILYFGADRYAGNGSAQMAIWFFQDEVGPDPGNPGRFTGKHEDGDILVLSDFTNGGAATNIRVFQWKAGGPINGTLELLAGTLDTPADCVGPPSVPAGDPYCATVNTAPIDVPWAFFPKGAKGNGPFQVPAGQFYEGGIDLAFLNLGGECFASFIIETRSSPSVDAVLKDFVGGGFEACESTLVTTPVSSNQSTTPVTEITLGTSIVDYAVLTGAGSNLSPAGNVTFFVCGPTELTPPTTGICDLDDGTAVPPAGTPVALSPIAMSDPPASFAYSQPFTPTSVGRWCFRAHYAGDGTYPAADETSAGECFTVTTLQPSLSTAQTWSVVDKVTIVVTGADLNLSGTVNFKLYNTSDCSGTAIFDNTKNVSSTTGTAEVTSDTKTFSTSPGALKWKIFYDSTNSAHNDIEGACGTENATLTYANGGSENTPPK